MARSLDLDDLVEYWTLLDDERDLVRRPAVADGGHLVNTCPIG
jgi:hypothetical protein